MGVAEPHFVLMTRGGCHLCNEMADLLDEVLPAHGLSYEPFDVDTSREHRERYGDTVPVLLRDGRAVAKIRLDRRRLERIIRRRR